MKKRPIKRPWSVHDCAALLKHSKKRTPILRVSKEMKRTVGALRWKACQLGVGLGVEQRI